MPEIGTNRLYRWAACLKGQAALIVAFLVVGVSLGNSWLTYARTKQRIDRITAENKSLLLSHLSSIQREYRDCLASQQCPKGRMEVDPYLQIPARVIHLNAPFVRPYSAERDGLRVKYLGNRFSKNQPDFVYVPSVRDGKYLLNWQTSENGTPGLLGLAPGAVLLLTDNELYDFGAGALFVKVFSEYHGVSGFLTLETLIGETAMADDALWVAKDVDRLVHSSTVDYDGVTIYALQISTDKSSVDAIRAQLLEPENYAKNFNGGKTGIHPVFAANQVYCVLLDGLREPRKSPRRQQAVAAAECFFKNYVIPRAVAFDGHSLAWPYEFEWVMNWSIKLEPPWYSAYSSGVFSAAAAILYRETGKAEYRDVAVRAANYLGVPISKGGAEYTVNGFHLPAEYVYATPPMPNVRVIDGELIAVTALFTTACLLEDSRLLQLFLKQAGSVTMQMDYFAEADGDIRFAMYVEKMPKGYYWLMWSNLQALGNMMKDRRFADLARRLRPHVPKESWELLGE